MHLPKCWILEQGRVQHFGEHSSVSQLIYITENVICISLTWMKKCRAMRAVWPKSIEKVNLVEPSKEMQRAGKNLLDSKRYSFSSSHDTMNI